MSKSCPECGTDAAFDGRRCVVCGYAEVPQTLVLSGRNGRCLRICITTSVGRPLLRGLDQEDSVYAADLQFEVIKDIAAGAWRVRHHDSAKNPTFYNGEPVTTPSELADGGVVSIGSIRLPLTVSFEND